MKIIKDQDGSVTVLCTTIDPHSVSRMVFTQKLEGKRKVASTDFYVEVEAAGGMVGAIHIEKDKITVAYTPPQAN